jgi:nitroreductase
MNFHTLVLERESIRSYDKDREIPRDSLERILDAGRLAPSAGNRQPWEFLLVSSKTMLKKIRPCYKAGWFQDAPHILVVKGNRELAWTRADDKYNSLETDLTIAMDHMILAADFAEIATCWIAAFNPELLRHALNLNEHEEVFAITPLGYPLNSFKKKKQKKRKPFNEVVSFI